jgi:hypothetical protein
MAFEEVKNKEPKEILLRIILLDEDDDRLPAIGCKLEKDDSRNNGLTKEEDEIAGIISSGRDEATKSLEELTFFL